MKTLKAELIFKNTNDGSYFPHRIEVDCIIDQLPHHKRGLQYTASGYGSKIPTEYKIIWDNRKYRVYCAIYSNIGTLYIISKNEKITVDIYNENL